MKKSLILLICLAAFLPVNLLYAAPAALFGTTAIADIAERVSPAVVAIESVNYVRTRTRRTTGDPFFDSIFAHLFEDDFSGRNNVIPKLGNGSGVIISEDGHLLTNDHVINGADEILVKLSENIKVKAEIVGKDSQSDLAVLKIKTDKPLPFIPLGDSSQCRVGEWVVAIGNPFGLGITVTAGVISAINRDISVEKDHTYRDLIQTDASINPGNSGGALVNSRGELIGVNTAILPSGQGIGFAIPVNRAKRIVGDLMEYGRVKKAFVGISVQAITPDLASYFNVPEQGVLITEVVKGSAAGNARLAPGDVILAVDGKPVSSPDVFQKVLDEYRVNDKAVFTLFRKGKKGNREIEFKENPFSNNVLGVSVDDCSEENIHKYRLYVAQGSVITGVAVNQPAYNAGLKKGDVIVQINEDKIFSSSDFYEAIEKYKTTDRLILKVVRGRHVTLLLINLG